MLYINRDEINELLDFKEIVESIRDGFKLYSQGKTVTPPYIDFSIPDVKRGHVHFKSGYIIGEEYFTLKYSSGFWSDELNGLRDNGLFLVFNARTGRQECFIDDLGHLTNYRTGVAGAIATKAFARSNSEIVTIIGSGIQARMQICSLMNLLDIKKLKVWGRNSNNVDLYISEMKEQYPSLIIEKYDSIESSVKDTDIIITTTYSSEPLIKSEWIKDGTHITAVGACGPNMQELDETILGKANKVFADSREMCSRHGEISHALKREIIKKDDIIEIGEALDVFERSDADITIADLVGLGFQDAVIGSHVYKKALQNKIGNKL